MHSIVNTPTKASSSSGCGSTATQHHPNSSASSVSKNSIYVVTSITAESKDSAKLDDMEYVTFFDERKARDHMRKRAKELHYSSGEFQKNIAYDKNLATSFYDEIEMFSLKRWVLSRSRK
jgi:hypothetical protein